MGAKVGRKGSRSYNFLTYGVSSWRKYMDKKRRKSAKKAAIEEQMEERAPRLTKCCWGCAIWFESDDPDERYCSDICHAEERGE